MIRGVLGDAARQEPAIELIDAGPVPRPQPARGADAEVVLAVTADPHDHTTACALLEASGAIRVALLTPAGRELVIYDLASHPLAAGDLPASELLRVICQGVLHA